MIRFRLISTIARLSRCRRANVAVITAVCMVPMIFAIGFGVDYSRAMRLRTRLNAAADAAALAAVSSPQMQNSDTAAARSVAVKMFNAQVSGLSGLVFNSGTDLTVTVATSGSLNNGRTVVVSYRAQSQNMFGGILGRTTLPLVGSSQSDATKAPYINFYLVLDTSPSMLLPSTSDGLNKIRTATTNSNLPNGCAFACHVQKPHDDNIYVRDSTGKDIYLDTSGKWWAVTKVQNNKIYARNSAGSEVQVGTTSTGQYADGYWLTRNYSALFGGSNIQLRLDAEQEAAEDLIPFARDMATSNRVTYKLQVFSFGYGNPTTLTSTMADVNGMTAASIPNLGNLQPNYWKNNWITSTTNNGDMATEFTKMFNSMSSTIPNPGDGASASTPQAVMFIVTDGMSDEWMGSYRNNRELRQAHLDQCTAIKNRGIRIAILYTEYLPESLTGDSWSQSNVAPYLNNVEPALRSCASQGTDGTALFYKVTTDESISTALTQLFALTVQSAHLTR